MVSNRVGGLTGGREGERERDREDLVVTTGCYRLFRVLNPGRISASFLGHTEIISL